MPARAWTACALLALMLLLPSTTAALPTVPLPVVEASCPPEKVRTILDAVHGVIHEVESSLCVRPRAPTENDATSAPAGGDPSCTSTSYALSGHRWSTPMRMSVDPSRSGLSSSAVLGAVAAGGEVWDDLTSQDVWSNPSLGGDGLRAGTRDGVNQVGFVTLSGTGVVGRATTWFTSSGTALESDIRFSTSVSWSTQGAADKLDLQSVAAHEVGHSLGLDHAATGSSNACLTMYPSTSMGSTAGRTPERGDIMGFQNVYDAAAPSGPFEATFSPKAGNEWWVETRVSADRPLAKVQARVDDGAWRDMSLRSWGAWAASIHAPAGSVVTFAAVAQDGGRVESGAYRWPDATPTSGAPAAWSPTFVAHSGNAWWVEARVESDRSVARVWARVDGGAPQELSRMNWGTWGRGMGVPEGATVTFEAEATDGSRAASEGGWVWPDRTPVEASAPLDAAFRKGGANAWWVEVWVDAAKPLQKVSATVDGGTPVELGRTSWGSWAKSMPVAEGAAVRFTATATDGSFATSSSFRWP